VKKYSVKDKIWNLIALMKLVRKNEFACSLNTDMIYVFGGSQIYCTLDSIEKYSDN